MSASGARAIVDHNSSAQFPLHPGSDSHRSHPSLPSLPAFKPGTNQSGQSYAMSEDSLANVRVRPNRRPLWIGLFIIMVGVGVVLFVGYGGSTIEPQPEDPTPGSNRGLTPDPDPEPQATADAAVVVPPADDIRIELTSEPSNAEVYLAGKMIGKTPLDHKQPRSTGSVSLVVQHAGFENTTLKVDLGGDYSKKVTLVAEKGVVPDVPVIPDKPEVPVNPEVNPDKPVVKPDKPVVKPVKPVGKPDKPVGKPDKPVGKPDKPVGKPDKPVVKPDKPPAKDCQIPGQAMPFDPRPVCKS
jgi:hypothetical protein